MDIVKKWVDGPVAQFLVEHWVNFVGIIVASLLAYVLGSRLIKVIVRRAVRGTKNRQWHKKDIEKREKTLVALFRSIWRIAVIIAFLYSILKEFFPNIETTLAPLFASAGIIGVAIGFGAQSLIKDFLSGIFIISENQYRIGDIVEIEGASGTVERIGTRSTVLRDADGNVHYFPNGMVQHVINKTLGFSVARFIVQVQSSADIDDVVKVIDEVGKSLSEEPAWKDRILEAPSFAALGEITGLSTEVIISGKTQPSDQWAVASEMRRRLHETFEDNGIKLAITPQMQMGNSQSKK